LLNTKVLLPAFTERALGTKISWPLGPAATALVVGVLFCSWVMGAGIVVVVLLVLVVLPQADTTTEIITTKAIPKLFLIIIDLI